MIDLDLLTAQLRKAGHTVGSVIKVPENAGEYEFVIDGQTLTLEETRALLAEDQASLGGPPRTETFSSPERAIDDRRDVGPLPTSNTASDPTH